MPQLSNPLAIKPAKNNYNNTATLTTSDILGSPDLDDTRGIISVLAPGSTSQDISFIENPIISDALKQYEVAYDEQVKNYTELFKQQYEQEQQALAVSYQENLRRSAELSQGVSTGQAAISKEAAKLGFEAGKQQLTQSIAQTASETFATLQSNFAETLANIFGEITEDGRFSKLVEYTETADIATAALWDIAANKILESASKDTIAKSQYIKDGTITNSLAFLEEQGILALDLNASGYYLTDMGYLYIDELLNSEWSINTDTSKDGITIYDEIIDEMINAEYDIDTQANWTDIKREQIREKYIDFLVDFGQPWRYTHIGLWKNIDGKIEVDTIYSVKEYNDMLSEPDNLKQTSAYKNVNDFFSSDSEMLKLSLELFGDSEKTDFEVYSDLDTVVSKVPSVFKFFSKYGDTLVDYTNNSEILSQTYSQTEQERIMAKNKKAMDTYILPIINDFFQKNIKDLSYEQYEIFLAFIHKHYTSQLSYGTGISRK